MNPMQEHAAEAALSKVTYGAAGSAIFFGLTANEWAAFLGVVIAIIALITKTAMDWHFKSEHLKLAQRRRITDVNDNAGDE